MSSTPTKILFGGIVALIALLALQWLWHGWLAPPKPALRIPTLTIASVPLLFSLWLTAKSLRRGALIGGTVCLFYFAHGVSELWSGAPPQWPAALEVALSLAVIASLAVATRASRRAVRAE